MSKISASIICSDFSCLADQINQLENIPVEYIHVDIMDGHFVSNYGLGPDFINSLRKMTKIPKDLHLMINQPERHIDLFNIQPKEIVTIHFEASKYIRNLLKKIRNIGAKAGLALNPGTPISVIADFIDDLDLVTIMTVNPGFKGQKIIPHTLEKVAQLNEYLRGGKNNQIEIAVDGNISYKNAERMKLAGANIFIAGTSSVFKDCKNIYTATQELRRIISK